MRQTIARSLGLFALLAFIGMSAMPASWPGASAQDAGSPVAVEPSSTGVPSIEATATDPAPPTEVAQTDIPVLPAAEIFAGINLETCLFLGTGWIFEILNINAPGSNPASITVTFSDGSVTVPAGSTVTPPGGVQITQYPLSGNTERVLVEASATGVDGVTYNFSLRSGPTCQASASSPTATASATPTDTFTPTEVIPSSTPTDTFTPTEVIPSSTPTDTFTPTEVIPSLTPTDTFTPTEVIPSLTPTDTFTPTEVIPSSTPTDTFTPTETIPSSTPTDTATNTAVPPTLTPTDTATNTPVLPSSTPSNTATNTTVPPSFTPSNTSTSTPSQTATATATATLTATSTATSTPIVSTIDADLDPDSCIVSYRWLLAITNQVSAGANPAAITLFFSNGDEVPVPADVSPTGGDAALYVTFYTWYGNLDHTLERATAEVDPAISFEFFLIMAPTGNEPPTLTPTHPAHPSVWPSHTPKPGASVTAVPGLPATGAGSFGSGSGMALLLGTIVLALAGLGIRRRNLTS